MPIYEYRCTSCGFEQEVLQKISETPLTDCPSCGKAAFSKLISAAGFQLKGTGWYATDFRGNGKGGGKDKDKEDKDSGKDKDTVKDKDKDSGKEESKKEPAKAEATCGAGSASE
jgi:putative FmdB family regulatory protein